MAINNKDSRIIKKIFSYLVLFVFALIAIFPVWQVVNISLRPANQLLSTSLELIPANATFDNYLRLFT